MPDHPFPDPPEDQQHRPERKPLVCFAADAETEEALRTGLGDTVRQDAEFRRADITRAITALREMPTPGRWWSMSPAIRSRSPRSRTCRRWSSPMSGCWWWATARMSASTVS
ncbi:hypothetical protein [Dankookia sp. P2]|uniref:hypothetical protein n=1 Tax=Dankookia sp. P2 TaxID=3423955 RepID=UPI003D667BF3